MNPTTQNADTPRARSGRCGACGKALGDGQRDGLCAGCTRAFHRIYGNSDGNGKGEGETTMAKGSRKSGQKNMSFTTETDPSKPGRRVHRVVEEPKGATPSTPPPAPEAVTAPSQPPPAEEAAPPSAPSSAPASAPPPSQPAPEAQPAASGNGKFPWLERENARRALDHAISQISHYDYSKWSIDGVPAALALLKNASDKMAALSKKGGAAKIESGSTVKIRAKHGADYDGIIDGADREGMKVLSTAKGHARCETRGGEKVVLPVAHLETQP